MKNPEYFRIYKDGQFAGFKRVVTEYLPSGHSVWQLARVDHDPAETQKLSKPALGTENLKRERISSDKIKAKSSEEVENGNRHD